MKQLLVPLHLVHSCNTQHMRLVFCRLTDMYATSNTSRLHLGNHYIYKLYLSTSVTLRSLKILLYTSEAFRHCLPLYSIAQIPHCSICCVVDVFENLHVRLAHSSTFICLFSNHANTCWKKLKSGEQGIISHKPGFLINCRWAFIFTCFHFTLNYKPRTSSKVDRCLL